MEYIGIKRGDIVGHKTYDISPKSLADIYNKADSEMIENGIKTQYYETKLKKNNEKKLYDVIISKSLVLDDGEVVGIVGIIIDITSHKKREKEMSYLSNHDDMTGLFNRIYFKKSLIKNIANTKNFLLICIDLNNLKFINDNYGHLEGDNHIVSFCNNLSNKFYNPDIISRMGGDEFSIISFEKNVKIITNKLKELLEHSDFSYGIAEFPEDSKNIKELMNIADSRMYENKYEQKHKQDKRYNY